MGKKERYFMVHTSSSGRIDDKMVFRHIGAEYFESSEWRRKYAR
jgi:hypothetical protein